MLKEFFELYYQIFNSTKNSRIIVTITKNFTGYNFQYPNGNSFEYIFNLNDPLLTTLKQTYYKLTELEKIYLYKKGYVKRH